MGLRYRNLFHCPGGPGKKWAIDFIVPEILTIVLLAFVGAKTKEFLEYSYIFNVVRYHFALSVTAKRSKIV